MSRPGQVLLGHGAGGLLTRQLVREIFRRELDNDCLAREEDAAFLQAESTALALTTDAFVVEPLFFAGGDIGKLAVCGTVNDLLVSGARPRALTAAFILEEGLPLSDLQRIAASMATAAAEAAVQVVAGDTKVVPRGKADGCFITTAGVGVRIPGAALGADRAQPGDKLLLSGPIGDHGAAIMTARTGIELQTPIRSDCAPLNQLLLPVLEDPRGLRAMRDPTRGGLATVLCEIAESSQVSLLVEEASIPVAPAVRAACELMGLDPLYLACEGRAVLVVAADAAARVLATLRRGPAGEQAACIGEVATGAPRVVARTAVGGHRLITMLSADPLPRIC